MSKLKTKFQKTLPTDIDTLIGVIKIFHPNIPDTFIYYSKNKGEIVKNIKDIISVGAKYDWVTIYFKAKDYGTVSIGIRNGVHPFSGPGISKEMIKRALKDNKCTINSWRFYDDLGYDKYEISSQERKMLSEKTAKYLLSKGYSLQTPDEMYEIYYEE